MAEINLSKYGISGTTEIVHNPSYDLLFEEETKPELEGYEKERTVILTGIIWIQNKQGAKADCDCPFYSDFMLR